MSNTKLFLQSLTLCALVLAAGCSSSNPSRYYENDGPPGLFQTKFVSWGSDDVKIKVEPPNKWANRPYTVMGKRYYPVTGDKPMTQVGTASWYGKQFHGKKTAIGEIYDMHAMTAAHPTMELPSFAKVTNLQNGRSIIVRVNDRGPFLHSRIIDLSYAAAVKLGYQKQGTARVRVERITRSDIAANRIPSTSAGNAVLVAATAAAKKATSTRTTSSSSGNSVATKTTTVQPERLAATTKQIGKDVTKTVVSDSEFSKPASVTLSIPVESTEVQPQDIKISPEGQPTSEDTMRELIIQTQQAADENPQAPAEVLPTKISSAKSGHWTVQIGAFSVQENARQAAAHAEMMLASVQNASIRVVDTGKVWKVVSGNFITKDEASRFARTVTEALGTAAFAVAQ